MNGNGTPVTRAELREELAALEAKFDAKLDVRFGEHTNQIRLEIAGAMSYVVDAISVQMNRMRDEILGSVHDQLHTLRLELSSEIAGAARAAAEESRRELRVVDDRYRDLPGRVGMLERELDEHRRDGALHARPRRRPPR